MIDSKYYNEMMGVAVIGMSCNVPGANSLDEFWNMIAEGRDGISMLTGDELLASGVSAEEIRSADYVRRCGYISDVELFDPEFFNMSVREAEITDPAQRMVLMGCARALQDAGHTVKNFKGEMGVFAGTTSNDYYNALKQPHAQELKDNLAKRMQFFLGEDKDYCASRVSYKLNLTGPSISVSTACSTGLVAVHLACKSLLSYECDMAFASGAKASYPHKTGYRYEEGGVLSKAGVCAAFDADAAGTVFTNGACTVLLKRLEDAIADRDNIYAIIRGSATCNDGGNKTAFSAPSIFGQTKAISEAVAVSDVDAGSISYVEAHGTGTSIGDPIEVESLSQIYRAYTDEKQYCGIGSVKTNIGHIEAGAGIAGLIKTAQAMQHKKMPPSIHFTRANPKIDFLNSPFYVNTALKDWQCRNGQPRRAAVSSFGMGGSNAHVVLEEAPERQEPDPARPFKLLKLSARNETSLEAMKQNLASYLSLHPDLHPADMAYTLQVGRDDFNHRAAYAFSDVSDAISKLQAPARLTRVLSDQKKPQLCFMFPGQGSQHINMLHDLYLGEPVFRDCVDHCSHVLTPLLGVDLRDILYPAAGQTTHAGLIDETRITQPALFVVEYALARLWMSWGIAPKMMIGHSVGEYVAACLAGVLELDACLDIIAARGRLMQSVPAGAMLAISAAESDIQSILGDCDLAAVNSSGWCVVSGSFDAIAAISERAEWRQWDVRPLRTSHAFHSQMMTPILAEFENKLRQYPLKPPQIPFVSNVTGVFITDEEATSPAYWSRHLRQAVHFYRGIVSMIESADCVFLEVGPGNALSKLVSLNKLTDFRFESVHTVPSCRLANESTSDQRCLTEALGKLWLAGLDIDWAMYYGAEKRRRVSLPGYAFLLKRCWLDAGALTAVNTPEKLFSLSPLGSKMTLPFSGEHRYQMTYGRSFPAYMKDHIISEVVIMPGAGYLSLLLSAVQSSFGEAAVSVRDIYFVRSLIFDADKAEQLQLILQPQGGDDYSFKFVSIKEATVHGQNADITLHCEGRLTTGRPLQDAGQGLPDFNEAIKTWNNETSAAALYAEYLRTGYEYGASFKWITAGWKQGTQKLCRLQIPDGILDAADYILHPGVIDSCFQLLSYGVDNSHKNSDKVAIPFHIASFQLYQKPQDLNHLWCCHEVNTGPAGDQITLTLLDDAFNPVAQVSGLTSREVNFKALKKSYLKQTLSYQVRWHSQELAGRAEERLQGKRLLIVAGDQTVLGELQAGLLQDHHCSVLCVADGYALIRGQKISCDFDSQNQLSDVLERSFSGAMPEQVLFIASGPAAFVADYDAAIKQCKQDGGLLLSLTQLLAARAETLGADAYPVLTLFTQGGQTLGTRGESLRPDQFALTSLAATISQEYAGMSVVTVDFARDGTAVAACLADEMADPLRADSQVVYREGHRYVARLEMAPVLPAENALQLHADRSYLITGGFGALGLQVAGRLADLGAGTLILAGRSAPSAAAQQIIGVLREKGVQILCEQADMASMAGTQALFDRMAVLAPPLAGIIHSAGVLDDGIVLQQNWQRFQTVLAPKLACLNLHQASLSASLDFFLLFSSISSVLGTVGQANYAMANGFMDGFVHYRRALGLPAHAINWGAWGEVGMAANLSVAEKERAARSGLHPFSLNEGLDMMELILASPDTPQVIVTKIDWVKVFESQTAWSANPLFLRLRAKLGGAAVKAAPKRAEKDASFLAEIVRLDPAGQSLGIAGYVLSVVGALLNATDVTAEATLANLGIDSLMTLELRNQLQIRLGLKELPVALMLREGVTVTLLAEYVQQQLLKELEPASLAGTDEQDGEMMEMLVI